MTSFPLIDIHTHALGTKPGQISVRNLIIDKDEIRDPEQAFTAGLHPWYITPEHLEAQLVSLAYLLALPQCVGLGECGLDTSCKTDWALQKQAFTRQIELSETTEKPVIIHCVRAHNEVIAMHKALKPKQTWVMHGFRKDPQTAKQCIDRGIHLSFGAYLITAPGPSLVAALRSVPADMLHLETDQDINTDIIDVYNATARLLRVNDSQFDEQIWENARKLFKI